MALEIILTSDGKTSTKNPDQAPQVYGVPLPETIAKGQILAAEHANMATRSGPSGVDGDAPQMTFLKPVTTFKDVQEFYAIHGDGAAIEFTNEASKIQEFNDSGTERTAYVLAPIEKNNRSLRGQDFRCVLLVMPPSDPNDVFPEVKEPCTFVPVRTFEIDGRPVNPGLLRGRRIDNPFDTFSKDMPPDRKSRLVQYAAFEVIMPNYRSREGPINLLAPLAATHSMTALSGVSLGAANEIKVVMTMTHNTATYNAEMSALRFFVEMQSNDEMSPTQKQRDALQYLLHFKTPAWTVNIFDHLPHMLSPGENPNLLPVLRVEWERLNEDHRKAWENLEKIPAGIMLTIGGPGAGKTALCILEAVMAMSEPKNKSTPEQQPVKVLYLIDMNQPANDVAGRVYRLCREAGLDRLVIRVTGFGRELQNTTLLNRDRAPEEELPDFSKDFTDTVLHAKVRDMSKAPTLDEAAFEHFEKHRSDKYRRLDDVMQSLKRGNKHAGNCKLIMRELVYGLYSEVVGMADFVAATPVAASGKFPQLFKPDIVFNDEAGHMRELTSLMAVANFPDALAIMYVGDTKQTQPYVEGATTGWEEITGKGLKFNQFAQQMLIPMLERADQCGAVESKLLITQRMRGNLHDMTSEIFFDGNLRSGIPEEERFTPEVKYLQNYMEQFSHHKRLQIPCLLVRLERSREQKRGHSYCNPANEMFIMDRAIELLNDPAFRRVDRPDEPGRIMIITPYRAALRSYECRIAKLPSHLRKRLGAREPQAEEDQEQMGTKHGKVDARTVDTATGHEADMVLIDTVRTTSAGFLDTKYRLCVMVSRPLGAQMILMHEAMTWTWDGEGHRVKTEWLSKIYNYCTKRRLFTYIR